MAGGSQNGKVRHELQSVLWPRRDKVQPHARVWEGHVSRIAHPLYRIHTTLLCAALYALLLSHPHTLIHTTYRRRRSEDVNTIRSRVHLNALLTATTRRSLATYKVPEHRSLATRTCRRISSLSQWLLQCQWEGCLLVN
jgi:hypothetical protein